MTLLVLLSSKYMWYKTWEKPGQVQGMQPNWSKHTSPSAANTKPSNPWFVAVTEMTFSALWTFRRTTGYYMNMHFQQLQDQHWHVLRCWQRLPCARYSYTLFISQICWECLIKTTTGKKIQHGTQNRQKQISSLFPFLFPLLSLAWFNSLENHSHTYYIFLV